MDDWMRRIGIGAVAACGALLLVGCGLWKPVVDSTRFYLLDVPAYAPVTEANGVRYRLALRHVRVTSYLEASPGIAVREGTNRVFHSQRHRWAEPVREGVARLVTENLRREPAVASVSAADLPGALPAFDLYLSVERAEGVLSDRGEAFGVFEARWELRRAADGEVVTGGSVGGDPSVWNGRDFEQLARSLSEGVAELSRRIAVGVSEADG